MPHTYGGDGASAGETALRLLGRGVRGATFGAAVVAASGGGGPPRRGLHRQTSREDIRLGEEALDPTEGRDPEEEEADREEVAGLHPEA